MDITGTIGGGGVIATGPDGVAQGLQALLSPAYGTVGITSAGSLNAKGQILASVLLVQNSRRFARLVPINPCTKSCVRVAIQQMTAKMVSTCNTKNEVTADLIATNESGKKLAGVTIKGRFMDDYWMNKSVSGVTNTAGVVSLTHKGPGCVGAIALFVESAQKVGKVFDQTQGMLTKSIIPPH